MLDDVEQRFQRMFWPTHAAFGATSVDRARLPFERGPLDAAFEQATRTIAAAERHNGLEGSMSAALRIRAMVAVRQRRLTSRATMRIARLH